MTGIAHAEPCWKEGKHKDEPLDCLTCRRRKSLPKERIDDPDTLEGAFIGGYMFAVHQIILCLGTHSKITKTQEKVIRAAVLRTHCAIDRGVPYVDLLSLVNMMTLAILKDELAQGGKKNEDAKTRCNSAD
jgi:hypothetical protein